MVLPFVIVGPYVVVSIRRQVSILRRCRQLLVEMWMLTTSGAIDRCRPRCLTAHRERSIWPLSAPRCRHWSPPLISRSPPSFHSYVPPFHVFPLLALFLLPYSSHSAGATSVCRNPMVQCLQSRWRLFFTRFTHYLFAFKYQNWSLRLRTALPIK